MGEDRSRWRTSALELTTVNSVIPTRADNASPDSDEGPQAQPKHPGLSAQGTLLAAIGSVIGLAVAFPATRLLTSLLYNVSAYDFSTFTLVTLLLAAVVPSPVRYPLIAPRVDPMTALRAD